jgi:hypothetical protein
VYLPAYDCNIKGRHRLKTFDSRVPRKTFGPNKKKVDIFALLGYYAALSGNSVPTFRDNISVPSSRVKKSKNVLTLEDGTRKLSRNIGTELPLNAA